MKQEEIIRITETDGKRAVSARELHQFLESKQQFADWIKNRIDKYGFVENQDFEVFHNLMKRETGGTTRIEYALSVDMAKELSVVENNEKGRQARKYFIECERRYREETAQKNYLAALKALIAIEEEKERLRLENKQKDEDIERLKPKEEYFDDLVDRNLLTNFRDTAKELGIGQKQFINNRQNTTIAVDTKVNCKIEMLCQDLELSKKKFIKAAVDYFWNNRIDPRDVDTQKISKEIFDEVSNIKELFNAQSSKLSNMGALIVSISGDTQWLTSRVSRIVKHWWNR